MNIFFLFLLTVQLLSLVSSLKEKGLSYADLKKVVQKNVGPGACYDHWKGDGICDEACRTQRGGDGGDCLRSDESTKFRFQTKQKTKQKEYGTQKVRLTEESRTAHVVQDYHRVAKSGSAETHVEEEFIRRGKPFVIEVKEESSPSSSSKKKIHVNDYYCQFNDAAFGKDQCEVEDHKTTKIFAHPLKASKGEKSGYITERKGSWWNLGKDGDGKDKKVNGRPDFASLPDTCKVKSVSVEITCVHTYHTDLSMKLIHAGNEMQICAKSKCSERTTHKVFSGDEFGDILGDEIVVEIYDHAHDDHGQVSSFSMEISLDGEGCPQSDSSEDAIVGYALGDGSSGDCTAISGKQNTYECSKLDYDTLIGRQFLELKYEGEKLVDAGTVFVLFNPFVEDSPVYMESSNNRNEFVMEQMGRYYFGSIPWRDRNSRTQSGVGSAAWNHHQFDPVILNALERLLGAAPAEVDLSSPVSISRHLTNVLSATSPRIDGVLHGKWPRQEDKDPYKDGKPPTFWTGSRAIFQKWFDDESATKYGQCWVFASILVTALRSLGVPSRSVTTFRSAHDTTKGGDYDFLIHYQDDDESIWNFHVWVDAWMRRGDLEPGKTLEGWNAVDATPQERSDGAFQCGPAYVPWIQLNKNIEHETMFDAKFVLGEVNAVHRFVNGDDRTDVGRKVVTKKKGVNQYGRRGEHDVTGDYKKCGSAFDTISGSGTCVHVDAPASEFVWPAEEDENRFRSLRTKAKDGDDDGKSAKSYDSTSRHLMVESKEHPLCAECFRLQIALPDGEEDGSAFKVGSEVSVAYDYQGDGDFNANDWDIHIVVEAVSNNGAPTTTTHIMERRERGAFTIQPADYEPFLSHSLDVKIVAVAWSDSLDKVDMDEIGFEFTLPRIKIESSDGGVALSFRNSLTTMALTDVTLFVDEAYGDRLEQVSGSVAANGGEFSHQINLANAHDGGCVLISVNCKELFGLGWGGMYGNCVRGDDAGVEDPAEIDGDGPSMPHDGNGGLLVSQF